MIKRKIILFFASIILIFGTIMSSVGAGSSKFESYAEPLSMNLLSMSSNNQSGATYIRKGDVNFDGAIGVRDARLVLRISLSIEVNVSVPSLWAGDVDMDGKVKINDARLILRASLGLFKLEDLWIRIDDIEDITSTPTSAPPASDPHEETDYVSGSILGDDVTYKDYPLPPIPAYAKDAGTFAIVTFGYGHGVGMSQWGAIELANSGFTYRDILKHYFKGVQFKTKEEMPEFITIDNTPVEAKEAIARVTQQEIGGYTSYMSNSEALKAQVVAAFTYIERRGSGGNYSTKGLAACASINNVKPEVLEAVDAVWGEYVVDSSGRAIDALFYAQSAGRTVSPSTVWGGSDSVYPYLAPVDSPFDRITPGYIAVRTYTVEEIRGLVEQFNEKVRSGKIKYCGEIQLSSNPGDWFRIIEHDKTVSDSVGYVTKIQVGNQVIELCGGQRIRADLFGYKIRSHCMIIEYYSNNNGVSDSPIYG